MELSSEELKAFVIIPSEDKFLKDKNVSDRLYAWLLLVGEIRDKSIYIKKNFRKAYINLGINYRTFYSRLQYLIDSGYLLEEGSEYKISLGVGAYNRYVSKETVELLLSLKIDNIIKLYIHLSSLYGMYKTKAFFTYDTLLEYIGYYHNYRNKEKVKVMLDKLESLGLIEYRMADIGGNNCQIKYYIKKVRSEPYFKLTEESGDRNL